MTIRLLAAHRLRKAPPGRTPKRPPDGFEDRIMP